MARILKIPKDNRFVATRQDMFTADELNKIIEQCEAVTKEPGLAPGIHNNYRKCDIAWIPSNETYGWIYDTLSWNVDVANRDYFEYDLSFIETLQYTVYTEETQGFYKKHIDMGERDGGGRKLTFVLQLSDPWEYEGGELKLYLGELGMTAPKERCKLIFFPSWMMHEVTPVTKGVRRSLVGWVHGPKFK